MAKLTSDGRMFCPMYIDAHIVSEAKWKARRLNVTLSAVVNQATVEYLDRHPRDQEEEEKKLYETTQA